MAPKVEHPKLPPTTTLGPIMMTERLITNMESLGMISEGDARAPRLSRMMMKLLFFTTSLLLGFNFWLSLF
jgi:hypothetical protein